MKIYFEFNFWLWLCRFSYKRMKIAVGKLPEGIPGMRDPDHKCSGYTPRKWIIDQWGEAWVRNQWDASDVISSLEEFAEAYHKERMDDLRDEYTEETFDLRDELIKFGEWLSTESSPIIFNMRNTVDEYLTLPKIKKG